MIAYATLGTDDIDHAILFYDAVFGAIGGTREVTTPTWVQYGRDGERAQVCLTPPHDGGAAACGNGTMLAFETKGRACVDAVHVAALAHGGTDAGLPSVREGTHYGAYVRDPAGNKLCVFTPK